MCDNTCMGYTLIDLLIRYLLKKLSVSRDGDKITENLYLLRIHKIEKNPVTQK